MNNVSSVPLSARTVIATLGFLAIAAFFLQTEHRAHLFGVLPFLLLLACPLLHRYMHDGHDDHDLQKRDDSRAHQHSGQRGGL
ncbi:MAG: DUF2933 domain-containing protein [Gemmatimonadaceae bacterium]